MDLFGMDQNEYIRRKVRHTMAKRNVWYEPIQQQTMEFLWQKRILNDDTIYQWAVHTQCFSTLSKFMETSPNRTWEDIADDYSGQCFTKWSSGLFFRDMLGMCTIIQPKWVSVYVATYHYGQTDTGSGDLLDWFLEKFSATELICESVRHHYIYMESHFYEGIDYLWSKRTCTLEQSLACLLRARQFTERLDGVRNRKLCEWLDITIASVRRSKFYELLDNATAPMQSKKQRLSDIASE
jgi:hypothetical protein